MAAQPTRFRRTAFPAGGRRGGFTLLELFLVLAILVLLGALTWPALTGPLAVQRLKSGADKVRIQFVQARLDAVSKGRVVQFRFTPAGDRFLIESMPTPEAMTADADVGGSSEGGSADESLQDGAPVEDQLPEGVRFAGGSVASDLRAVAALAQSAALPPDGDSWSEPIFFYPDGSASTATVLLQNQRGSAVEVSLRGATGVVSVGPITSPEELSR